MRAQKLPVDATQEPMGILRGDLENDIKSWFDFKYIPWLCIYVCIYLFVYMYMCIYLHMYVLYFYIYIYIHIIYTYTCTHIYIYIYIHAHISMSRYAIWNSRTAWCNFKMFAASIGLIVCVCVISFVLDISMFLCPMGRRIAASGSHHDFNTSPMETIIF